MKSKRCPKCDTVKTHSEFYAHRDGASPYCKSCTLEYDRARRKRYADKIAEQKRDWRVANPEKVRQQKQRHATKHSAVCVQRVSEWRKKNPVKRVAQEEKRRVAKRGRGNDYTTSEKIEARFALYGGKCRYCGIAANSIDHRIPLARGGSHLPANLIPACRSCNSRKHTLTEPEFLARG